MSTRRATRPSRARPETPATRRSIKRVLIYAGAAIGAAVAAVLLAAELRYGFVRIGPAANRAPATADAGVVAIIDPVRLAQLAGPEIASQVDWPMPGWVLDRIMPYDGGAAAALDLEARRVDVRVFVNPKALLPVVRRLGDSWEFSREFPQIRWKRGAEEPERGLVVKHGVVPFSPEADEAFWYTWNQSVVAAPLSLEGGHLFEAVFDNRQGHAYLIAASMLEAYDIELGSSETEVSLSSLQFVREARWTADLAPPDSVRLRLVLDILPDAVDRLGVINLKIGIDDGLERLSERWQREHGLKLEGSSAWAGTQIVYDYRLTGAKKAFHLLVTGELP